LKKIAPNYTASARFTAFYTISGAALVLSLATSGLMGWTANRGGRIRHVEIRADFKAPAETETGGEQKTEKEEDLGF